MQSGSCIWTVSLSSDAVYYTSAVREVIAGKIVCRYEAITVEGSSTPNAGLLSCGFRPNLSVLTCHPIDESRACVPLSVLRL